MKITTSSRYLVATVAGLLCLAQAQAMQITANAQRWSVDWSIDLGTNGTLSATSDWIVNSFSRDAIVVSIDITNTSRLNSLLTNADISAFGFASGPQVNTRLLEAGSVFSRLGSGNGPNRTFPGGFKGIDVCLFAQGCAGGSVNSALRAGQSDHIQLLLSGDFSNGIVDLRQIPLKFQTSKGSYEAAGCINCPPANKVPEPPGVALLGAGLLLLGFRQFLRTRRARAGIRR